MSVFAVVYRGTSPEHVAAPVEQGVGVPTQLQPDTTEKPVCAGTKTNGDPCGAAPKAGSAYCVRHQDQDDTVEADSA